MNTYICITESLCHILETTQHCKSTLLQLKKSLTITKKNRHFPGGPVVKTLSFYCRQLRFNLWLGNKDPTGYKTWPKKMFFKFFLEKKKNNNW